MSQAIQEHHYQFAQSLEAAMLDQVLIPAYKKYSNHPEQLRGEIFQNLQRHADLWGLTCGRVQMHSPTQATLAFATLQDPETYHHIPFKSVFAHIYFWTFAFGKKPSWYLPKGGLQQMVTMLNDSLPMILGNLWRDAESLEVLQKGLEAAVDTIAYMSFIYEHQLDHQGIVTRGNQSIRLDTQVWNMFYEVYRYGTSPFIYSIEHGGTPAGTPASDDNAMEISLPVNAPRPVRALSPFSQACARDECLHTLNMPQPEALCSDEATSSTAASDSDTHTY